MKVVIAHRTRQARVVDLPEPQGGRNFVTVRVSHSAMVLPNELQQIESAESHIRVGEDGFPLGSCASGTIIAVGEGVTSLKSGLRVAVSGAPYVYHGSQLVVPENLAVELPKKVNHEEGAFAGIGAKSMHLLRVAGVQLGETVLVFGADLLGIIAAQLIRAAGATPILVDESEFRLNKGSALGLPHAFERKDPDFLKTVNQLTDAHGADAALLTRGGDRLAFAMAEELLRDGGVMVLGTPLGGEVSLDRIREKQIRVRPGVGGGAGTGDRDFEIAGAGYPRELIRWTERDNMACFCQLLADRKVQISPLVTDRIPIDRAPVAYEKAARGRDSSFGVVLTY